MPLWLDRPTGGHPRARPERQHLVLGCSPLTTAGRRLAVGRRYRPRPQ